jgi:drug/metabolite transporter (DMT)-like permease
VKQDWYVVGLCLAALLVLVLGAWFVRHELSTRVQPPPAVVMWLAYLGVLAVVVFGAAWTSHIVLQSKAYDAPIGSVSR